jgi:FkbM family methyltransferase
MKRPTRTSKKIQAFFGRKKVTNRMGYDWGAGARRLIGDRRFGTIIDVGAAYGTPWLYDLAPEARRVLVEPLDLFNEELAQWKKEGDVILNVAAGDKRASTTFNVDMDRPMRSSLYDRKGTTRSAHPVEVFTLAEAVSDLDLAAPYLIKIDVEGHELQAVMGSRPLLAATDAVIIEVSQSGSYENPSDTTWQISRIMSDEGLQLAGVLAASVKKEVVGDQTRIMVKKADLIFLR